jgi:hypothetical protein
MLIGIAGQKFAGKDTVAHLINGICSQSLPIMEGQMEPPEPYEVIQSGGEIFQSPFRIKKFADKIKDMTCVLLNCTRQQLEDPVWKEESLGEGWLKYKLEYTIFTNHSGDMDGEFYYSTREEANAEMVRVMRKVTYEKAILKYINVIPVEMSPRLIMQTLGTEWGREIIHPDLWVLSTFRNWNSSSDWIITDVRYTNEANEVLKRGGILIKVNRNSSSSADTHASEQGLEGFEDYDFVINNNHDLINLQDKIYELCLELDLI